MSKAEKFIQDYTRNCSNIVEGYYPNGKQSYFPWLHPKHARNAVEIAREETIKEVCEWIEENIGEYCDGENIVFSATHIENADIFEQEKFIKDLKQAMKDE